MSGAFTVRTRVAILDRDQFCIGCGSHHNLTIQHRRARGMGGSKDPVTRSVSNGLVLCGSGTTGCHGWTEVHPMAGRFLGWRVNSHEEPAEVPVYRANSEYGPHWALLEEDGSWKSPINHPSTGMARQLIEDMFTARHP